MTVARTLLSQVSVRLHSGLCISVISLVSSLVVSSSWGAESDGCLDDLSSILRASSDCVIDCAEEDDALGPRYDDCLEECCIENCRKEDPDPGAEVCAERCGADIDEEDEGPEPSNSSLWEALAWAQAIQDLRDYSDDPIAVATELRELFEAPWPAGPRRFVDAYVVSALAETATSLPRNNAIRADLHDLMVEMIGHEHFHNASRTGRAGILSLAAFLNPAPGVGVVGFLSPRDLRALVKVLHERERMPASSDR